VQAIADVLKKKGLINVTAEEVAKVIDELKTKGTEAVKEQVQK
jgi:Glu-tRNA(Gln) amidotransferase subunit E-like FAD-binding protein